MRIWSAILITLGCLMIHPGLGLIWIGVLLGLISHVEDDEEK